MVKLVSFCLALLMLGCSCGGSPSGQYTRTPQQVESINHAVVALVANVDITDILDIGPQMIYCSGAFVSRTEVLTAAHCVESYQEAFGPVDIKVGTYQDYLATSGRDLNGTGLDGEFEQYHWSMFSVVSIDPTADLALLRLAPDSAVTMHTQLRMASSAPSQGENVILMGHPRGLGWSLTSGVVSSPRRYGWANEDYGGHPPLFIQHDAESSPGNSGGPLLNIRNEIVGVLVQGWDGHLAMSVHTTVVSRFLRN